jgi:hypothetical protein
LSDGELRVPLPFVTSVRCGEGRSIVKLSLDIENCLPPPEAEAGEASGELDIAEEPGVRSGVLIIDNVLTV